MPQTRRQPVSLVQITGENGRLGDEIGPIHTFGEEGTIRAQQAPSREKLVKEGHIQITGENGRLGDEIGPIHVYGAPQAKVRLK